MSKQNEKINVLDIYFDNVTSNQALEKLLIFLSKNEPHVVITANPEFVMEARNNHSFQKVINNSELVVADGIGVVLASKIMRTPLPERVAGCDLMFDLFEYIKNTKYTVYFLGGAVGVTDIAKAKMERKYAGLKIVGTSNGYFDSEQEKIIVQEIKTLKPDILLVGLGFPRQEMWIDKHKNELGVKILVGVGGSFDVMAEKVQRAPESFRKLGLEWFYRLLKEPKRIVRMMQLPLFVIVVIIEEINKIFNKK